jgi:hypothetical protein
VEAVLSKGDIFGEVSFLFGMRQTSHARTPHNMTATLFTLPKPDYTQVPIRTPCAMTPLRDWCACCFYPLQGGANAAGG